MNLTLKSLASIPKMVWGVAKPKLERNQWVIASLKGSGYEVLKPDFESIYAHALVEYAYDAYPDEGIKTWVDFFSFKDTATYIKQHLYQKPENELETVLDGLLHTGQGQTFLALKNIQAQTTDVMQQYQTLKKHLEDYTQKSRNPAENQHFELTQDVMQEVKNIQKSLLTIASQEKNALITFDDSEMLLNIDQLQEFVQQNHSILEAVCEKLENAQNDWKEWIEQIKNIQAQTPQTPATDIKNSKNVVSNVQIGNIGGNFIVGDNNKIVHQNAEKIYNIDKIDKADFS
jgi:hypothetical protein